MARKPRISIEILIDQADLRCTLCNAPRGRCNCWTACSCGWSYETGGRCRNPVHRKPNPTPGPWEG